MKTLPARSIEIDMLRTAAIIGMLTYHAAYDLQFYAGWGIDVFSLGWMALERITVCTFLLLTGLCFMISWAGSGKGWRKYLRRGLTIFGYGMVVSLATYLSDPPSYVRFGILHLIGLSTISLPVFVRFGRWNILLGTAIIASKAFLPTHADSSLLLPLGFTPPHFISVDYFPLIPWFGVILIGMSLGSVYVRHPDRYRFIKQPGAGSTGDTLTRIVESVSKHSLLIYMLHQPVFLLILEIL